MAVPKKKVSKARRDKRRSNVWKLDLPGMVKCTTSKEQLQNSMRELRTEDSRTAKATKGGEARLLRQHKRNKAT